MNAERSERNDDSGTHLFSIFACLAADTLAERSHVIGTAAAVMPFPVQKACAKVHRRKWVRSNAAAGEGRVHAVEVLLPCSHHSNEDGHRCKHAGTLP